VKIHELKTHPEPFQGVVDGVKHFEFRLDDRVPRYELGDRLLLREYDPHRMDYTGRSHLVVVTYVLRGPAFGIPEGFVCLSVVSEDRPPGVSLLEDPLFPTLEPYIEVTIYDRDGGHANPRVRIELSDQTPPEIQSLALAMQKPCVACYRDIHPFRARNEAKPGGRAASGIYYAATCTLDANIGCSRGDRARDEYKAIRGHYGK
jgi:hypothetical protein